MTRDTNFSYKMSPWTLWGFARAGSGALNGTSTRNMSSLLSSKGLWLVSLLDVLSMYADEDQSPRWIYIMRVEQSSGDTGEYK